MAEWREADHPRDHEGQFTEKLGWAGRALGQMGLSRGTLRDAIVSGEASVQPLRGRNSNAVLVTHRSGRQTVRKTYQQIAPQDVDPGFSSDMLTPGRQADSEELVSLVGQAIGAPVPAVERTGPNTVHIEVVPGQTLLDRWISQGRRMTIKQHDQYKVDLSQRLGSSDAGLRLGVLDLLTDNWDRANPGNTMVDEGDAPWGIDHAFAFHRIDDPAVVRAPIGTFARQFFGPQILGKLAWADNSLTAADVAWLRGRLHSVKQQFVQAGHRDWWDFMSARLELLGEHATGTESRLT